MGATASDFAPPLSPAAGHALTGSSRGGGAALRAVTGRGIAATYEAARGRFVLSAAHFQQPRAGVHGVHSATADSAAWGWGSADTPSADTTAMGSLIPGTLFQCTVRPRKRLTLALASISRYVPSGGARAAPPAGISSTVSLPGLGWIRPLGDSTPRRPAAPGGATPRDPAAAAGNPRVGTGAGADASQDIPGESTGTTGSTVLGLYATAAAGAHAHAFLRPAAIVCALCAVGR